MHNSAPTFPAAASVAYSYSSAGDLLTFKYSITGTGAVPQYTLSYAGDGGDVRVPSENYIRLY